MDLFDFQIKLRFMLQIEIFRDHLSFDLAMYSSACKRLLVDTLKCPLERLSSQQIHVGERTKGNNSMHDLVNARDPIPKYVFQFVMQAS